MLLSKDLTADKCEHDWRTVASMIKTTYDGRVPQDFEGECVRCSKCGFQTETWMSKRR